MGAVKKYRLDVFQNYPEEDMTLYLKQLLVKMTNGNVNKIEQLDVDYKQELYKLCSLIIGVSEKNRVFDTELEAKAAGAVMAVFHHEALVCLGNKNVSMDVQVGKNPDGEGYCLACVAV